MTVTLNKMNKLNDALKQCEIILKMSRQSRHENALKMYGAKSHRKRRYKKAKEIYTQLLNVFLIGCGIYKF